MSSRLRKAYVAAKFYDVVHCCARARHSEATAARSSGQAEAPERPRNIWKPYA